MNTSCRFSGCSNPVLPGLDKCSFHKARKVCQIAYCSNIVYARGKCVRHGGRKKCQHPHCTASAHRGDYCFTHGGDHLKRICSVEGCKTQAHARRLCVRHGGGRQCAEPSCTRHAKVSGYCGQHRPDTAVNPAPIVDESIFLPLEKSLDEWNYLDSLILDSVLASLCTGSDKPRNEPPILERRVFIA
ncbi:hypothetical protein AC1031_002311 [Aphanomyces cochlioides]|nr:hypothetical protein AC1031_002311 [Aphanomyces cochlioides]